MDARRFFVWLTAVLWVPKVHADDTPFTALGCQSSTPLDGNSIWQGATGVWHSCNLGVRSDGMSKCVRANGQVDQTSIYVDLSTRSDSGGCFAWEAPGCGTDMTRVKTIEFDFDFAQCDDVWAAPLWISPINWKSPGGTSGEIDFLEMCPVGSVSTNFGAGGQVGENQMQWGSGNGADGPKHFTLTLDDAGNLKTTICNLDRSGCFDGAFYDNFMNRITSKNDHHFISDVWNGYGGDGGWTGCSAKHNAATNCRYAIMNIAVHTKDGQPLYSGTCAALNGQTGLRSNTSSSSPMVV